MPFSFPAEDRSRRAAYTQNSLDRMSAEREDADFVAAVRNDAHARVIVAVGDKLVLDRTTHTILMPAERAQALGADLGEALFLGLVGWAASPQLRGAVAGRPAVLAAPSSMAPEQLEAAGLALVDLRTLALEAAVPAEELGAAAEARAVFNWHQSHRHCSRCGSATTMSSAGFRRDCPSCGAQHFPRTDPVVIMAIVRDDRILLGRQARFPPGMYSCLAGFVEPGETIEDAVRRETWEEAGIRVGRVGYHSSQPWPFPNSLMLGCFGEAETGEIVADLTELEDCRWFDRPAAKAMFAETHPEAITAPKPLAIAHHLLKTFIETA
ncbi:MAG: NAD(+) diphosphatase [Ancalomicrobiaceae bacterium]|nr:NAD(+) diphosphatase [Ancalomicrobiaceae bacterium]